MGYFGVCVGLCFGFGHFSVVEFSSMQRGGACLISGLCWAIVGYDRAYVEPFWWILWFVLAFVGQELGPNCKTGVFS